MNEDDLTRKFNIELEIHRKLLQNYCVGYITELQELAKETYNFAHRLEALIISSNLKPADKESEETDEEYQSFVKEWNSLKDEIMERREARIEKKEKEEEKRKLEASQRKRLNEVQ